MVNSVTAVVAIFAAVLAPSVLCDGVCSGIAKGPKILPDPDDCAKFYICHGSRSFQFSCATKKGSPLKRFDPVTRTCVLSGSVYDHSTCNTDGKCQAGVVSKEADEDSCARYYHCDGGPVPRRMECPYPRLFDRRKGTCQLYLFVTCDTRKEIKDPCDYEANQCFGSGCVPCRARFGTCIGLPDGPNPFEGKLWTPHFVICRDQRVILHGDCREKRKLKLFNPFSRRCNDIPTLLKQAKHLRPT